MNRGRIDVVLTAATPGARSTVVRHLRVPVTIRPSPPVPEPLDVRARRDGADLVVSWRTAFPARHTRFLISANGKGVPPLASRGLDGRGRRSFRVRLKGAARARSVSVFAYTGSDQEPQRTTVHVR
jgi:hypothetical protein